MTDEKPVLDPRASLLRPGSPGGNAHLPFTPSVGTSFEPKPALTDQEVEAADQALDTREAT